MDSNANFQKQNGIKKKNWEKGKMRTRKRMRREKNAYCRSE
jgi:hypothetical protein